MRLFRRQLTGMVRSALPESSKTAVILTHYMAEALALADEVVVLAAGRVQQAAPQTPSSTAPRCGASCEKLMRHARRGRITRGARPLTIAG